MAASCVQRAVRSSPEAVRAVAAVRRSRTCTQTSGLAARLTYQEGWAGAPPFEAMIT